MSHVKRRVKEVMVVTGVVLVVVALARPQYGSRWEQAHRRGVDVLFAVDTSKSMLTADVKPNRLERAKLAVRDLVEKFPEDRVGLVAFAGSAFLETPLTLDHAIFEQSLDGLDTTVIPLGGTDVTSAIEVSKRALADDDHKKIMILLTDGEDLSGDAVAAARAAAKDGLTIYTVGVGTPRGELVPLTTKNGQTTYVQDEGGKPVTSKLDEALLRSVATATGGGYRALGDDGRGLDSLYREDLASLPRSDLAARTQQVPIERYQWPLGLGLLLLGLEPLINERRRARRARVAAPSTASSRGSSRPLVAAVASALAALLLLAPIASASPQSAEHAYHDGKFAKAQGDYANAAKSSPSDPRLQFNLGTAAYRNGALDDATKAFEAALHTDDTQLQQHAYYDLGDVLYRKGQATLKDAKTDETIRTWKQAISSYESGLRLDAKDADATFNRDFVKRKLAELEKKKQDEQAKNDEQKKQQDKKQQDQKGQGQNKPGDSKSSDAKG
ncbi:MAG: VWA domain-containing protein, partial [Polyangiaceae bacterium]